MQFADLPESVQDALQVYREARDLVDDLEERGVSGGADDWECEADAALDLARVMADVFPAEGDYVTSNPALPS